MFWVEKTQHDDPPLSGNRRARVPKYNSNVRKVYCKFLASYGVIFESDFQSYFKTLFCGVPLLNHISVLLIPTYSRGIALYNFYLCVSMKQNQLGHHLRWSKTTISRDAPGRLNACNSCTSSSKITLLPKSDNGEDNNPFVLLNIQVMTEVSENLNFTFWMQILRWSDSHYLQNFANKLL